MAMKTEIATPTDPRLRFTSCHGPEHLQYGRDRTFHHDSTHDGFHGRPAIHAGLGDGRAHRNFRRSYMERTGGGVARFRRQLPFSSRGIRPSNLGSPDGFSFHLAIRAEWAFGSRIWDDWIRKLFDISLAGIERSRRSNTSAVAVGLAALFLLCRQMTFLRKVTITLWVGTVLAMVTIIVAGFSHFNAHMAFDFPPGAWPLIVASCSGWAARL